MRGTVASHEHQFHLAFCQSSLYHSSNANAFDPSGLEGSQRKLSGCGLSARSWLASIARVQVEDRSFQVGRWVGPDGRGVRPIV